jgi:hypothetical protein
MIAGRHAEKLCRHDCWQRRGKIRDHIHAPLRQNPVDQIVGYFLDMQPEMIDAARGESARTKTAQPRMRRRVHEQHLPDHDLGDRL